MEILRKHLSLMRFYLFLTSSDTNQYCKFRKPSCNTSVGIYISMLVSITKRCEFNETLFIPKMKVLILRFE